MAGVIVGVESNLPVVRRALQNLLAETPSVGRKALYDVARAVSKRINYTKTSPKPRGKYTRTYTLRSSKKIIKTDQGYLLTINPIGPKGQSYGKYVLGGSEGEKEQSWFHRGRWIPVVVIANEEAQKLPPLVLQSLQELVVQAQNEVNTRSIGT